MTKKQSNNTTYTAGSLGWWTCWLFTIGFVNLEFGEAILGLIVWPYYLGFFLGGKL